MCPIRLTHLEHAMTSPQTEEGDSQAFRLKELMRRHAQKLKQWVKSYLCLEAHEDITVLMAQRQCPDPGCDDMETLLGIMFPPDYTGNVPPQEACQIVIPTPMLELGYRDITHWAETMVQAWPQGCILAYEERQARDPLAKFFTATNPS
ncbi:MAG: hypothetical protein ACKO37_00395 [Vampirovibrionales bacterium]